MQIAEVGGRCDAGTWRYLHTVLGVSVDRTVLEQLSVDFCGAELQHKERSYYTHAMFLSAGFYYIL